MKRLISLFFLFTSLSSLSFANCDYSKIQKVDGGYLYSKDLHICVGEMKRDLKISQEQNSKYLEAISLKDLALEASNKRANEWESASLKLQSNVNDLEKVNHLNKYVYFGIGVLATSAAIYLAGQLR